MLRRRRSLSGQDRGRILLAQLRDETPEASLLHRLTHCRTSSVSAVPIRRDNVDKTSLEHGPRRLFDRGSVLAREGARRYLRENPLSDESLQEVNVFVKRSAALGMGQKSWLYLPMHPEQEFGEVGRRCEREFDQGERPVTQTKTKQLVRAQGFEVHHLHLRAGEDLNVDPRCVGVLLHFTHAGGDVLRTIRRVLRRDVGRCDQLAYSGRCGALQECQSFLKIVRSVVEARKWVTVKIDHRFATTVSRSVHPAAVKESQGKVASLDTLDS